MSACTPRICLISGLLIAVSQAATLTSVPAPNLTSMPIAKFSTDCAILSLVASIVKTSLQKAPMPCRCQAVSLLTALRPLCAVSSVLCSTLLTSLVSRHGGTDMLAAFAAVAVSTKTASSLFAFLGEGVAAKVGRSAAWEAPAQTRARVGVYLGR